jgi:hypothetical protein
MIIIQTLLIKSSSFDYVNVSELNETQNTVLTTIERTQEAVEQKNRAVPLEWK